MGLWKHEASQRTPKDGIDLLPECPGIYAIFNRVTRRFYVGQARNVRKRCMSHKSQLKRQQSGCRMGLDAKQHGAGSFIYLMLQTFPPDQSPIARTLLEAHESKWINALGSHTEQHGYNKMVGGAWTIAARFRDHERKLLRRGIRYMILPWGDMDDVINPELIRSWVER